MIADETVDKFTKVLASIYSNLMLREIEALRNGVYRDLTFHEIHTIETIGDLENGTVSQIADTVGVTCKHIFMVFHNRQGATSRYR